MAILTETIYYNNKPFIVYVNKKGEVTGIKLQKHLTMAAGIWIAEHIWGVKLKEFETAEDQKEFLHTLENWIEGINKVDDATIICHFKKWTKREILHKTVYATSGFFTMKNSILFKTFDLINYLQFNDIINIPN